MKVYTFGNDYAHQRKINNQTLQSEKEELKPSVTSDSNHTDHAGNQVQSRGEGEAMATEADKTPAPKKAKKVKKETRAEDHQSQDQG